ncbi:aspartate/glutamate racemase family protein [Acetivibrio ethanolgignens]|uniref:Asp/Glu racemase n=1 Tax=Acetivibrio ethanolgignens TaxID=290052 RepID=A0A0V8QAN1_9FIRM|nr:aspartate/glutamate racemase family protein [Acetivibrio ethanolgignens]KSV57591.1 Asp/Glu racemase [Acetivibrio ethanolgignens]
MKCIALIHTVKGLANSFEGMLRKEIEEEIKVQNLWDDFLADNPNEIGEFTIENRCRLLMDMKTQEMTGADMIVTTCSTLTPVVEMIRPFMKIPVIAIDDAMAKKAAVSGEKIMVLATAESTVEPTVSKIQTEAQRAERKIQIEHRVCMEAFRAMKQMDMERHDRLLKEMAGALSGYDCIVLAQASMSHLEKEIRDITGIETLSSPRLCMEEIKKKLEEINYDR